MAKELKKIFPPGTDRVEQTYVINAWHVSQSVDALTGEEDYDITISGSLTVTGSVSHDLIPNANGAAASVLVRDNATGEYKITGSYSVDYVDVVSLNGTDLEFTGVGDGFDGDVDLSSLVDYVDTVSLNGTDLEFTGVGDAFAGTVPLASLVGSTDYVSNVTLNTSSIELEFTGVGNGFDGDIDLSRFNDNGGGFTFRYSGSVKIGQSSWSGGEPNKEISTAASHLTASGANEWHFSDIGRSFSSQFNYSPAKNIFGLITASVQNDEDVLVRVYDDKNPRYQAYYTNVGPATIENVDANAGDLVMDLEWVGGTGFGDLSGIAFNFPNGTNPNNTNVSFAFIGGGGGSSTTPGGSDTQVQFNDGGAFGGDPNFVWNKTQNQLTLIGNNNTPSLRLSSSIAFPSADQVLGELVGYSGVSDSEVGGIAIKSDGPFSDGDVPTRLEFSTTPDGTEVPTVKLQIKEDGQLIADEYGSGTFTGTAAKWLAVDSSGNVIEEDAPSGSFTRPGSDTSITYDTYLNSVSYVVDQVGTSPAAPNANGDVSIRYVGSNIGSNVDRIDVYKTDGGGSSQSTTLENLAISGSIVLVQVGAGGHTERYRIDSTPTDNSTYMSYAVVWESGDDAAFTTGLTMTSTFDSDYEYELATGYNRLLITNNSNSVSQRFRMVKPASAAAGDEVIVELKVNTSGQNVKPVYQVRNGSSLLVKMRTVTEIEGTTVSEVNLDTNDVAIMRFQVNDLGSIEGLTLLGANQMIYA